MRAVDAMSGRSESGTLTSPSFRPRLGTSIISPSTTGGDMTVDGTEGTDVLDGTDARVFSDELLANSFNRSASDTIPIAMYRVYHIRPDEYRHTTRSKLCFNYR